MYGASSPPSRASHKDTVPVGMAAQSLGCKHWRAMKRLSISVSRLPTIAASGRETSRPAPTCIRLSLPRFCVRSSHERLSRPSSQSRYDALDDRPVIFSGVSKCVCFRIPPARSTCWPTWNPRSTLLGAHGSVRMSLILNLSRKCAKFAIDTCCHGYGGARVFPSRMPLSNRANWCVFGLRRQCHLVRITSSPPIMGGIQMWRACGNLSRRAE